METFIINTISPNNDLWELSVELESPLHMKKGKVQKIEMKRRLSFYPGTESFEFITPSGEQGQQKVGKISQNVIVGNSIKYERRIDENEEEKQLRERKVIQSIADGDIGVEAIYNSMVENKPNEIELRC